MAITSRRGLKWLLFAILFLSTIFLLSFNATLRFIIDERKQHSAANKIAARKKADEKKVWDDLIDENAKKDNDKDKIEIEIEKRKRQRHERAKKEAEKYLSKEELAELRAHDDAVATYITANSIDDEFDDLQTPALEEEVAARRAHLDEEERELARTSRRNSKESSERERKNPTLGKFRTTLRPLDGFAEQQEVSRVTGEEDSNDVSGNDGELNELYERPNVQSYSRQARAHSTPATTSINNNNSSSASTPTLADAHYAKALRMLSSDFDKLKSKGGNAVPQEVFEGEYDQRIEGRYGRGEEFVKFELKQKRNSRRLQRKRRSKRKRRMDTSSRETSSGGGGSTAGGVKTSASYRMPSESESDDSNDNAKNGWEMLEDEPILNVALDFMHEWMEDTKDWIYETFGIDLTHYGEQTTTSSGGSGGTDPNGQNNGGGSLFSASQYEEDVFSWSDTRVGSQLIWMYGKLVSLWSRQRGNSLSSLHQLNNEKKKKKKKMMSRSDDEKSSSNTKGESSTSTTSTAASLSKADQLAREGLFHLEKAAELGHSEAQRMVANSLASGILPLSDHGLMHRLAIYEHDHSHSPDSNWTSILLQKTLQTPDDFSTGGQQLSKAILLWHISAMDGNVESAMALGYRHLYSATGGSTLVTDLADDKAIAQGYHPVSGGVLGASNGGMTSMSHYGVLGTCQTALAYYEAAANGVMDELENGPTKGKVNPPLDEHRLAEIYTHGGASSALDGNNKPDELEEALQYYRMLASRNRSPEPDLVAAFTIANFYFNGYRGAKQDLRLALKYYEICGDYNHWEGGGQAGLMHVWGIGMIPEERDLGKAYAYFKQGTPGGIDGCADRLRRKKRESQKKSGAEDVVVCDRHSINGMGLLHLLGVEGLIDRDVNAARRWFEHGKDFGCMDATFNYAMLRLGWMVTELKDLPSKVTSESSSSSTEVPRSKKKMAFDQNYISYRAPLEDTSRKAFQTYDGPSASDYTVGVQELTRAASKGHIQAKHRIATLHASGAYVPKKRGKPTKAVGQSCINALRNFKGVADSGHTISRRNRAAWKQYVAGDYESSMRNYLASAETGSEIGQVNAAFLLEQGYCLGMTRAACTHASIRLWRAAARQGNLEACLRVGDFYYYGRMKDTDSSRSGGLRAKKGEKEGDGHEGETAKVYDRDEYLSSLEAKAFYFIPGPYRWTRYILYPEELFDLTTKWLAKSTKRLKQYMAQTPSEGSDDSDEAQAETSSQDTCDEADGTCTPEWAGESKYDDAATTFDGTKEEDQNHMAIAAQYYRKAAEEHKSARANFNLGFMHEWGLGLTQDFPLAKRHYDLAGQNANMAVAIALWAMNIHQRAVKLGIILKEYAMDNNWIVEDRSELEKMTQGIDVEEATPLAGETSNNVEENPSLQVGGDDVSPKELQDGHAERGAREAKASHTSGEVIPIEDVINNMMLLPEKSTPGFFPDYFENGFNDLPWQVNLWTIEPTRSGAPFESEYSAYMHSDRITDETVKASLKLPINSVNGGRLCFAFWADTAMPWEDFRFSLISGLANVESSDYRFISGMTKGEGWIDMCFDIAPGNHEVEWSIAWPSYHDPHLGNAELHAIIQESRGHPNRPTGKVFVDNVRFFPFVYDNFETGDFSLQKWSQKGDGAPWVISEAPNAINKYAAHCTPTINSPRGESALRLVVDLGYTGALLTFQVKVRTQIGGHTNPTNALWFLIDDTRIRPWYGDDGEWTQYTHYIREGIHVLTWKFDMSGEDLEASAWLDDVKFYSREGVDMVIPAIHGLGLDGKEQGDL